MKVRIRDIEMREVLFEEEAEAVELNNVEQARFGVYVGILEIQVRGPVRIERQGYFVVVDGKE